MLGILVRIYFVLKHLTLSEILVSGCTANFEPIKLLYFLSNQCYFWLSFIYLYNIHVKIKSFLSILFLTPPLPPFSAKRQGKRIIYCFPIVKLSLDTKFEVNWIKMRLPEALINNNGKNHQTLFKSSFL